jgi:signal transduction histidine kinase/integral membrane sensor domain MASE1
MIASNLRRWRSGLPSAAEQALKVLLGCAALFVAYLALAEVNYFFVFPPRKDAIFWLASGLALAWFLRTPVSRWPAWLFAIFAAEAWVCFRHGLPLSVSLAWGVANCFLPLTGAWLLRPPAGRRFVFGRAGDVVRLALLGAGVGPFPGALLAAAANVAWLEEGSYWIKVATWWGSDALGVILLTPFFLAWTEPARPRFGRTVEALALLLLLTTAGWWVFATNQPRELDAALPFLLLPLIAWPALRLGARGATAATVILDLMATWHTIHERGPFAMLSFAVGTRILNLQLYIAFLNLFVLILAVVVVKEQQARAAAEQAEQRARFLAAASESLSASLDYAEILSALPRLCVQSLADWCLLDVVEDNGLRRLGCAHRVPSKQRLLGELTERYPPDSRSHQPAAQVLRACEPLLLPQTTDEVIRTYSVDDENARLIRELGTHTAMAVPLAVRGKLIGVLTLASANPDLPYGPTDIVFMNELGRRAAIALENARLYADVQRGEAELRRANDELEQRVEERTRELKQAQARLVDTAREVGMSEVASNVLHSVGNVLTSAVINLETMYKAVGTSRVSRLKRATALLQEHREHLADFLAPGARGHHLPGYLSAVADELMDEQTRLLEDMNAMGRHIEHIRAIVQVQQNYAKTALLPEECDLAQLIDDALRIQLAALQRHGVSVVRELSPVPRLKVDKHKVLQILVNLISNAKDALDAVPEGNRHLSVRLSAEGKLARIQVRDNGGGIAPEVREKLFVHGFTTRKDGHGFGLHTSALAAQMLGGRLTLESEGPGKGAVATLELPLP